MAKLDLNGVPIRDVEAQALDKRMMVQLKVKFNAETGSTEPDESDTIDLVEMTQTYKDQCGVEAAIRLIKTGQATPSQFADDGKHSLDLMGVPDNAADLVAACMRSEEAVKILRDKFGIPENAANLTDDQLSSLIGKKVEEVLGNYIVKQTIKQEEAK